MVKRFLASLALACNLFALAIALSLALSACVPSFRETVNCEGELCLSLEGDSLTLTSPSFAYGGVIVYADTVQSPYCVAPCNASEGALLRFEARPTPYPPELLLGRVLGLKRADASVVYNAQSREAVDVTLIN